MSDKNSEFVRKNHSGRKAGVNFRGVGMGAKRGRGDYSAKAGAKTGRVSYGARVKRGREVVGRAEWKLKDAVKEFKFDFRGKVVLDIGSSTGGFTELALRQGAKKVIAVEKGTGQMKAPLRFDPRVELHEKTDIFTVRELSERTEVVLADVSFVSLRPIILKARALAEREADFLMMLKPQFEAGAWQLKRGVVKNERIRREIIRDFEIWLKRKGFLIVKKRDNDVVGRNGNRERFYWIRNAQKW